MVLFSVTWDQRKFLWQIISALSNNPAADSSIGNDLAGTSKYIIIVLSIQTKTLRKKDTFFVRYQIVLKKLWIQNSCLIILK